MANPKTSSSKGNQASATSRKAATRRQASPASRKAAGSKTGGKAAGGKVTGGKAAGGKVTGSKAAGGKAAGGKVTGSKAAGGKAAGGKVAGGKATGTRAASGKAASGKAASGKTASGKTTSGKATAGEVAGGKGGPTAVVTAVVGDEESLTYTLARASRQVGPSDGELERAMRAAHPDAELRAEGARVASERILRDGERLCSKAVAHLGSEHADVKQAAREAGLTRELVATTVDTLRRLEGTASHAHQSTQSTRTSRQLATFTREEALASGRRLKTSILARLRRVVGLDPELRATLERASASASTGTQLAGQLDALAGVIERSLEHVDPSVRVLARSRGLDADDASTLLQHAHAIEQAEQSRVVGTDPRSEEQLAVLDVLDGLCLLLIEDVLRALRLMAQHTALVRRPTLSALATYFGTRSRPGKPDDTDEDQPPAP